MKTTLTVKHDDNTHGTVQVKHNINKNVNYRLTVCYGYETLNCLHPIVTVLDDRVTITISTYAPTLGEALNIAQMARFKSYDGSSLIQSSISMWQRTKG